MKQQKLFKESLSTAFGGELLKKSHAKTARPFSAKAAMHIVLKAKQRNLKRYDRLVENIIQTQAKKHYIKIYKLENQGNHIHLVVKSKNKDLLKNFLRSICGLIPRYLKAAGLWLQRPFSRLIHWGKDYQIIKNYMTLNRYEAMGYTRMQARFMIAIDQGLVDLQAG